MTDPAHLDDFHSSTRKPLSKKLVEAFRDAIRDPSVAKADYAQRLKHEMETALEEGQPNAANKSDCP